MDKTETAPPPALSGLVPGTLLAVGGSRGVPIQQLAGNPAAQSSFSLMCDQSLERRGWTVQLTGIAPIIQVTLSNSQRVRCGGNTQFARDVCRSTGELIWTPASVLEPDAFVLAIRALEPQLWQVCMKAHYATSRLRVMHVCTLPPSQLYSVSVPDFALVDESGAALLIGGLTLQVHRCPQGCTPTLPCEVLSRTGMPTLRPVTPEERNSYH